MNDLVTLNEKQMYPLIEMSDNCISLEFTEQNFDLGINKRVAENSVVSVGSQCVVCEQRM